MRKLPLVRFQARTLPGLLALTARRVPDRVFLRFLAPGVAGPPRDVSLLRVPRAVVCRAAWGLGARRGEARRPRDAPRRELPRVAGRRTRRAAPPRRAVGAVRQASAVACGPGHAVPRPTARGVRLDEGAVGQAGPGRRRRSPGRGLTSVLAVDAVHVRFASRGRSRLTSVGAALGEGRSGASPSMSSRRVPRRCRRGYPFLLLFTSGTTGRQKGVRLSQRTIVHAIEAGAFSTGRTERDVGGAPFLFGHVAGHDQSAPALAEAHTPAAVDRAPPDVPAGARARADLRLLRTAGVRAHPRAGARRAGPPPRSPASPDPPCARVGGAGARRRCVGRRRPPPDAGGRPLLGRSLRPALGGRIEVRSRGGAPTSAALSGSFEGLGIPLVELYGMSETAGIISSNVFSERRQPVEGVRAGQPGPRAAHRRGPRGAPARAADAHRLPRARGRRRGSWTADGFFKTGDSGRARRRGLAPHHRAQEAPPRAQHREEGGAGAGGDRARLDASLRGCAPAGRRSDPTSPPRCSFRAASSHG